MPLTLKAELIEGIVYMPSPVRLTKHGKQHSWIMAWLGTYEAETPGTESADNATIRLDLENEPQPDGLLRIVEQFGGQSRIDDDGYVAGARRRSGHLQRRVRCAREETRQPPQRRARIPRLVGGKWAHRVVGTRGR
jgi:hypothetical protein